MFQQYAFFPWKTAEENIAFGLRMQGKMKDEIASAVQDYLHLVGLYDFRRSYPDELSGGMQQRVAIARALAGNPRVLFMDEPFGSLDAQTREVMQESLLDIWHKFPKTIVFVTHDVEEAILLADRILVLTKSPGKIKAEVPVNLERPRSDDTITDKRFMETKHLVHSLIKEETLQVFSTTA